MLNFRGSSFNKDQPMSSFLQQASSEWVAGSEPVDSTNENGISATLAKRGAYEATVPVTAAGLRAELSPEVVSRSARTAVTIAHFDADVSARGELSKEVTSLLALLDAQKSSKIEGIHVSASNISAAAAGKRTDESALVAAANWSVVQQSHQHDGVPGLVEMQEMLLGSTEPELVGIRDVPVWIGSWTGPHSAVFVPPRSTAVAAHLEDLALLSGRDDVEAFALAALAHCQFETIHPFRDGNGRTGRAWLHSLLRAHGVTRSTLVPISVGLSSSKRSYIEALTAFRAGDLDTSVRLFADAAEDSLWWARRLLSRVDDLYESWTKNVDARADSVVWDVARFAVSGVTFDATEVAEKFEVSYRAANNAITSLAEVGVLQPATDGRRNRAFNAPEVLAAVDESGA